MGKDIARLEEAGASQIHFDVMDGMFVPNMSFGPQLIKACRKYSDLLFDVHLMIEKPERYIGLFANSGADMITIHQESTVHLHSTLKLISSLGKKAGIALNPATSISTLENIYDDIDVVLIMTVEPGFGGQKFIPSMLNKITMLKEEIIKRGKTIQIEIDGGVNAENAKMISKAGADIMVAGSSVFSTDNLKANINLLKS
jgi:ribulose-phosphate 3-epimerase